jgi:hypothetical protein
MTTMHSHRHLPPPESGLHSRRKIPPSLRLTMSPEHQWPSDEPTYLSPPMTNSPTSPNRTQFPEQRLPASTTAAPVVAFTGAPQVPLASTSGYPTTTSMTSQVYAAQRPLHPPSYHYGPAPPFQHHHFDRPDLQPRLPPQSMGHLNHMPPAQPYQPAYPMPAQYPAYFGPSTMGAAGPASIPPHNVPRLPRTAPRRGKVHVAKACQNCKKAHLSCDDARPCTRCVTTRKEVCMLL